MLIHEALNMAKNAGPHPRRIFIPRRDWNELFLDLRAKGYATTWITHCHFDNLDVRSAETNDPWILREANRLCDEEYRAGRRST